MEKIRKLPMILDNNTGSMPGEAKIIQIKQGVWRTYDATDGLPMGVHCLMQDRQGYLWLGTSAGMAIGTGLCRYDGAEFTTYTTDDGLAHNHIHAICEDHQGRLWLGTPEGVSCYDGRRFTTYTTEDGLVDNDIWAICEDHHGRLWFAARGVGVSCYDGQQFTNYTTENGLHYNIGYVASLHEINTSTGHIERLKGKIFDGTEV